MQSFEFLIIFRIFVNILNPEVSQLKSFLLSEQAPLSQFVKITMPMLLNTYLGKLKHREDVADLERLVINSTTNYINKFRNKKILNDI